MKETKFYLITDPHYFASSLGCSGKEYDDFMHYEQKCFAETESICKSVFEYLKNSHEAETVLICGDLIFNGEKQSHKELISLLGELKESGKKIFVVTADHDFKYKDGDTFAFGEKGRYSPERATREELVELYSDFGFGQAIAIDEKHLSYVAQIGDGVRLLALNADFKKDGQYHFNEEQLEWIEEQAEKAKEDGQTMFAMLHYPVLPGQPIFSVIKPATIYRGPDFAEFLADRGVNLIFTGHMHNQSINELVTEKGNKFYDVCTGAIIADPAMIRLVSFRDEKTVDIKSIPTPDFDFDTKGKDCKKYLSDMFDNMIVNVLTDMAYDTPRMMGKFHIEDKGITKKALGIVGKIICRIKVGTLARLLFIRCDKSIKSMRLLEYAAELVRNIFEGNQYFREGTPKGDLLLGFLKRIRFILKKIELKDKSGRKLDLYDVLKNTAGNYGIDDYNATLILSE